MKSTLLFILLMACVAFPANALPQTSTSSVANFVETKLTSPDPQRGDQFGQAVAIQGNIAVVGAPFEASLGFGTGAAYVFQKTTTGWQLHQILKAHDASRASFFGMSVAIDGDRIVVGASGEPNVDVGAGAAYVFVRVGTEWTPEAKLIGSENSAFDSFGFSVAIKGDRIVCGAYGNSDPDQTERGSAYVFRRIGGLWLQQQVLNANDGASLARFGMSVAMNDDTIAVGGDGDSQLGFYSGAVYIFTFDGSNWTQQQKLHAHDAQAGSSFGFHLAMSRETIVIGAPQDQVGNHTLGAAYIFTRGSTGWTQDRKLVAKDSDAFDGFGLRVGIDGDTIVVGSVIDHDAAMSGGAAYVYKRNGQSGWSLLEKLFASDAAREDTFGFGVAVSNNTVLVGAFQKSDVAFLAGAAYIFEF
ncbi:MAG TPA: FG-GAP repeat protein [Pyrinomonadaceae bacterium]|nr:FG-GAP repeat protein [Pyrinomonadaceae bacterium]